MSVPPAFLAPPVRRDLGPNNRGASLPSHQQAYSQAQIGERVEANGKRSQAYNLTAGEANVSNKVIAGCAHT